MNREKQIEEMANFLWKNTLIHTEDLCYDVAETLVIEGYSKQSEWISVEERLPEADVEVLVVVKIGDRVSVVTDRIYANKWFNYGKIGHLPGYVTHWMPLPEPPKMKGGGE